MFLDRVLTIRPSAGVLRRLAWVALAQTMLLGSPSPAVAEPLLMPDKESLYQRILTRPGAVVVEAPAGGATVTRPHVFSAYYVFTRETRGGDEWLEVGPSARGAPIGWMRADQSVAWRTTMTLSFTNPVDRLPVLFFEDQASLMDLVNSERLPVLAPEYVDAARNGAPPEGSGIVSIEPETWVDLREEFYLLPILEDDENWLASGMRATMVRVASIPIGSDTEPSGRSDDFRAGIMFVVDSTISMQPYIDKTLDVVRRIRATVLDSDIGDKVSFGLVEFRDATDPAPGLEYTTKVVAPLQIPPDHDAFIRAMSDVDVSAVTSAGFNEDGLAGVLAALGNDQWKNFGGRYIIYISDAGVREPPDPLASTGMTPAEINRLARDRVIAIFSMLLATPEGTAYHEGAKAQLRELSYWNDCTAAPFYSVPQGRLDEFGPTVDQLTRTLIRQIRAAADSGAAVGAGDAPISGVSCDGAGTGRAGFIESASDIGHAMQMAWLGRTRGTRAPEVFDGWAPDFALDAPTRKAFEVRVLLTKTQLSRMAAALQLVLEAGRATIDERPERFFDQLRTIVARAARDPSRIEGGAEGLRDPADLDNLGALLGEYLDDLPYSSQLMDISADTWIDASPSFQYRVLTTVRSKLRTYRHLNEGDGWVALSEDAPEDEWVYPVPLDLLP